ncbi:MAG TPA: hypothetical protein VIV06_08870, partial [Candidatus Limnocylindrales bacterium]
PSAPLAAHTTYTVELRPVVRRLGSEAEVAPDRTWSFTTGQPTSSVQNQIAFLSARAGVLNVWAMNPDGSNARQLTSELAPVTAFDVSADGESLLYGVAGQVVLQRADGSDRRVLTAPGRREYAPVLAPDGRSYLVARREAGGIDAGYWIVPMPGIADLAERQMLESGAPGAGSVRLTGDGLEAGPGTSGWGRRAAFSLDGKLALVVSSIGESWLVDLGAPLAVATKLPIAADGAPSWSESGGWFLLVGREVLGGSALFRVRTGGVVDRLWDAVGPAAAATNGGVTATVADPAGGAGVVRVAYASSSSAPPFALTTAGDLVDRSPSFSPDGGEIVFTRARRDAPTRSAGIWIVGLDGRELRQLSVDGASARWLP